MIDDLFDLFRSQTCLAYVLIVIPVAVTALAPPTKAGAGIVQEFKAFRLQHFDLGGNQKGSRSWKVNFDATSLTSTALRRCLVVSWKALSSAKTALHDFLSPTLGAVVIVIPKDFNSLGEEERQEFMLLEERLLEKPVNYAVYLAPETSELNSVLMNIERQGKQQQGSAASALLSTFTANSYHFVNEIQSSSVTLTNPVFNVVAKLSSFDRAEKVPSILIVADYDSFGSAPALSFGADSNGSGVTALIELLRLFSKIYENSSTRPRYNLQFLLAGAGQLNYIGTRQYIDDYLEQAETSNSPVSKLEFAICLDSLLSQPNESDLFFHVSKFPRANSSVDKFYTAFSRAAAKYDVNASMISKKINLADEYLAWEHERFSIRKLYAFTVSHFPSSKQSKRRSILDINPETPDRVDGLNRNIRVIAEALMSHVFQLPLDTEMAAMFDDLQTDKDKDFVSSWFDRLTSRSRAQQNFTVQDSASATQPKDDLLVDIFATVNRYSNEAHFAPVKLDKRDPEFVLYGATVDKLFAYRVKPAVFDLILALCITGYVGLIYLFVLHASSLQFRLRLTFDSLKKYV